MNFCPSIQNNSTEINITMLYGFKIELAHLLNKYSYIYIQVNISNTQKASIAILTPKHTRCKRTQVSCFLDNNSAVISDAVGVSNRSPAFEHPVHLPLPPPPPSPLTLQQQVMQCDKFQHGKSLLRTTPSAPLAVSSARPHKLISRHRAS